MVERIRYFSFTNKIILALCLVLLIGCDSVFEAESVGGARSVNSRFVGTDSALIYRDNPRVTLGNISFNSLPDIEDSLTRDFITANSTLSTTCSFNQYINSTQSFGRTTSSECLFVRDDDSPTTEALEQTNGSWAFPVHSDEFYQVNTFYHVNKIFERFG